MNPVKGPPSTGAKLRRFLLQVCSCAIILLFLIYACEYAVERHRRNVAERLIREIRRLEVGATTESEVNRLLDRFGEHLSVQKATSSSNPNESSALLGFSTPYLIIAREPRTLPGRRPWLINALLVVKDQRLSEVYISFLIKRSDGVFLDSVIDLGERDLTSGERSYFVSEPHVTGPPSEALKVHLGQQATNTERSRGFDINFSCLTALRECRHVCDVMPDAWQDLIERYPSGRGKQADADCQRP